MAAQMDYSYSTPKGVPGGKFDLVFDEAFTRKNEEADGVMQFGIAAMVGAAPGVGVKVPVSGCTAEQIEGVVLYMVNTEQDMKGKVVVPEGTSLSILRKGHVWGKTASDAVPVYGSKAYVVVDGAEAGCFTSASAAANAYEKCEAGTANAKEIVADDTASPTTTQIKASEVTPVADGYVPAVGDYVVSKQLHGATIDIGATFGTETDDGIAVIILK